MELKATLNEYTAPEFLALVIKIWDAELPKQEHDRLINHFDRVVGHPQGADLLFYPDEQLYPNGVDWVVYSVKNWHNKRGRAAFKGEVFPPLPRPAPLSRVAHNSAAIQKISVDVTTSEQALEAALAHFQRAAVHQRSREGSPANVDELQMNIRALEQAQDLMRTSFSAFEFWKMRVEFVMNGTRSDLTYAQSDQGQWQAQLQQISALHSRYTAHLASAAQRYRVVHDEAEALLTVAQERLIRARHLAGVAPGQAARTITASLACADNHPKLLLENDSSPLLLSQQKDFQKSIRSAVAELTWQNSTAGAVGGLECAPVLYFGFSSRADSQVYAVTVPLAELMIIEGQDWQLLAAAKAQIPVPIRMGTTLSAAKAGTMFRGLREITVRSQVYVTAIEGKPQRVRVRAARRGQSVNTFIFTADGPAPMTIYWSDQASLESSPPIGTTQTYALTSVQSLRVPLLEPMQDRGNVVFDDYIVVFPEDSALAPLYVMFRDRREYPV